MFPFIFRCFHGDARVLGGAHGASSSCVSGQCSVVVCHSYSAKLLYLEIILCFIFIDSIESSANNQIDGFDSFKDSVLPLTFNSSLIPEH